MHPERGTVLAFDFGEKRVGVAVGDAALKLAHPLTVIQGEGSARRFQVIAALVQEWRPVLLVVGAPVREDGTAHPMGERCRRFARRLAGRFGLPVAVVDERLTSWSAEEALIRAGASPGKRRSLLDAAAAQIILESYFTEPHLAKKP
jgi:putative Holliday junction resolvase